MSLFLFLLLPASADPVGWSELQSLANPLTPPATRDFKIIDNQNSNSYATTGTFQGDPQGAVVQNDNHWCGIGDQWCWDPAPITSSPFDPMFFPGGGVTNMTTRSDCLVDATQYTAPSGSVYRWIWNDCQVYQRWQSSTPSLAHAWAMEAKIGRAWGFFRYYCPPGGTCEAEPESNYPGYSWYTYEPGDWDGTWINIAPANIAGGGIYYEI